MNWVRPDGNTALITAASNPMRTQCVRVLVEAGADVNIQNQHGNTAFFSAVAAGAEESLKLLLNKGADVSIQNKEGESALAVAVAHEKFRCMKFF